MDIAMNGLDQNRLIRNELSQSTGRPTSDRTTELRNVLANLHDDQRTVLLLFKFNRLTPNEIAQKMGYSIGAIEQLLVDALKQIHEGFKQGKCK